MSDDESKHTTASCAKPRGIPENSTVTNNDHVNVEIAKTRVHGSVHHALESASATVQTLTMAQQLANQKLMEEMSELKSALENHLEFVFLWPDSHPMQGLQDWCTETWVSHLRGNRELAQSLAKAVLPEGEEAPTDPKELAARIKTCMKESLPVSKWHTIVAYQNAAMNKKHSLEEVADTYYWSANVLSNALFRRDFPLGVDKRVANNRYQFAILNSGQFDVRHRENKCVTITVYTGIVALGIFVIIYLLSYTVGNPDVWTMTSTLQARHLPTYSNDVQKRTKDRGRVASIIQALTFSALVNASLDKIGKIDPSTSTVMIGMFLGNTFGFILDLMLASDEGLREYLWRPQDGMKYALGALASEKFGRFFVTVLFDMFFTVILFKHFYSKLVRVAGFSQNGREWMANFVVSAFLGVITFVVYANLTRFNWAYPSGIEDVANQWMSGPTMLLATIIMNMVYLTSETRVRIEEPGINDPFVKLIMTMVTFVILYLLQEQDMLDPSEPCPELNVTVDWRDYHVPLPCVCEMQSKYMSGVGIFVGILLISLGAVIFGTSEQSMSTIKADMCPGKKKAAHGAHASPAKAPGKLRRQTTEMSVHIKPPSKSDTLMGHCCLFWSYAFVLMILMFFFSLTPFVAHDASTGERNEFIMLPNGSGPLLDDDGERISWRSACANNDKEFLNRYGLS